MSYENEVDLVRKVEEFYNLKIPIHITFKEGFWKRGLITEVKNDFFILDERLEGIMPIFFLEIKDVKKYVSKEKKKDEPIEKFQ